MALPNPTWGWNFNNTWDATFGTRNATPFGAVFDETIKKHGEASTYVDGNDTVSFGSTFPELTDVFSIAFWFYPDATQVQYANVFGNHSDGGKGIVMQQDSLNHNNFLMAFGTGTTFRIAGPIQFTANTWNLAMIVKDGTDVYLFKDDGTLNASGVMAEDMASGLTNLRIGQGYTIGRYSKHRNDSFYIFNNYAFTSEDRATLWANSAGVEFPLFGEFFPKGRIVNAGGNLGGLTKATLNNLGGV